MVKPQPSKLLSRVRFSLPAFINLTWPVSQVVKTPAFHAGIVGSNPARVTFGGLAQLGEHLPYKQGVTGSSPVSSINSWILVVTYIWLGYSQAVRQRFLVPSCAGSNPASPISLKQWVKLLAVFLLMSLDLIECVSRANARNKKPPAMRVGDKNYIKKASFALRCRCSSQSQ